MENYMGINLYQILMIFEVKSPQLHLVLPNQADSYM